MDDLELDRLLRDLGSPDPEVRDVGAFSTLASLIDEGGLDDQLAVLGDRCAEMLGHPAIQARTFAALILGGVVERLGRTASRPEQLDRWLQAFSGWFVSENDLRGYDLDLGWLHAVAHGADTIGCFAESGLITSVELQILLDLVVRRATAETPHRWTDGEDDRLAFAALLVLRQQEFGRTVIEDFVSQLSAGARPMTGRPTRVAGDNARRTARSLFVQLHLGGSGARNSPAADPSDRAVLLATLEAAISAELPWLADPQEPTVFPS